MKRIGLLLLCVFAVSSAFAQGEIRVANKPNYKHANWQVSVAGGVQYGVMENFRGGDHGDHITPQIEVAVGKWFNHMWGLRVAYDGFNMKGKTSVVGHPYTDGNDDIKFNYMNFHVDVMFDMFAAACPCRYRFYEMIPYVGVGYARSSENSHDENTYSVNAGLINRFRLSDSFDLNLNLNAKAFGDKFNATDAGFKLDGSLGATLGLTYKF